MIIIKHISVPVFQLHFSDTLSRWVILSGYTILSLHFSHSHMGKTKAYSARSCPDTFSCVVCREFFSIAMDYDAPGNF